MILGGGLSKPSSSRSQKSLQLKCSGESPLIEIINAFSMIFLILTRVITIKGEEEGGEKKKWKVDGRSKSFRQLLNVRFTRGRVN